MIFEIYLEFCVYRLVDSIVSYTSQVTKNSTKN